MAAAQFLIEARRKALALNAMRYAQLRRVHASIATEIEAHPTVGAELVDRARRQVALWAEAETCSPFYVRAWRRILRAHPEAGLRRLVEGNGGMTNAMLQNSPFSFALTDARFAEPTE